MSGEFRERALETGHMACSLRRARRVAACSWFRCVFLGCGAGAVALSQPLASVSRAVCSISSTVALQVSDGECALSFGVGFGLEFCPIGVGADLLGFVCKHVQPLTC